MSQINPGGTTAGDICKASLKECGAIGSGQTPGAEDITDAQARLQWMLQQWNRKRWLVYHLVDYSVVSTGALFYTIGPGGNLDTNSKQNPFSPAFGPAFGPANVVSARPARIESSFLRQLTQSQPNQIDYPMNVLQSREDYNKIALKQLMSFPGYVWLDADWPLGKVYPWPVPQPNIYALHVTVMEQLPPMFATLATVINLPYEYFNAMVLNLALRLRPKYGIQTFQGDQLPGLAKDSLNVLRGSNVQIAQLALPGELARDQLYNIFSDRMY